MSLLDTARLTLRQVANRCAVHPTTVVRWASHGVRGRKLRAILIGGRRYVLEPDLEAFLGGTEVQLSDRHDRSDLAAKLLESSGVRPR